MRRSVLLPVPVSGLVRELHYKGRDRKRKENMPTVTLVNRSSVPTPTLRVLLALAARSIGKRIAGPVVVFASDARSASGGYWNNQRMPGMVHGCVRSRGWPTVNVGRNRYKPTRGGWMELILGHRTSDPLWRAEAIFELAAHEWRHVYDNQQVAKGKHVPHSTPGVGGRRPRWAKRPEERRAQSSARKGMARLGARADYQERLIACAIEMDKPLLARNLQGTRA